MPLKIYRPENEGEPSSIQTILAIAAGKGGVGKSTVAVNLSLALQLKGYSVGLLDADLYGPSVRRMLPEDQLPMKKGEYLIPANCRGIKMVSMAYFRKEDEAAAVRAPIANAMITQFIKNTAWGHLDYLLIDFPPGTGDIQLTLSQQMPLTAAVMVTTPQEVALMDVRKAVNLFEQVKVPIAGIVENMSYFEQGGRKHYLFGKGGGERLAKEKGVPFLGGIPMDPALCECGDAGMSLFARRDAHALPAAAAFLECAEAVVQQVRYVKQQGPQIKNIAPKDAHAFWIEWNDGKRSEYRLSDLQKRCPCAQCAESKPIVDPEVKAAGIVSVGKYALRVEFTSGCTSGIYSYDLLRGMAGL